ncbi:Processing alpha glucosidase I [Saitoella coloradoensis]
MKLLNPLLWIATASSALLASASEPVDQSTLALENAITAASNSSLLWGPYRPGLYFGVRPRIPKSLMTGLMWANVDDYAHFKDLRHSAEQGDDVRGFGWVEYDARSGGRQVINDVGMNVKIETEFVKIEGGDKGGNWGVRIRGTPIEGTPEDVRTTLIFYTGLEGQGQLHLDSDLETDGIEGTVLIGGKTPDLGDFKVEITDGPKTNVHPVINHDAASEKDIHKTQYLGANLMEDTLWRAKDLVLQQISAAVQSASQKYGENSIPPPAQIFTLPNTGVVSGNFQAVQKTFEGSFEFDVLYTSRSAPQAMTSEVLGERIEEIKTMFRARFDKVFPLKAPFDKGEYVSFARELFSSLLGGVGYFHGTSLVDRTHHDEDSENFWESSLSTPRSPQEEGPTTLFTATPSRCFFPRGFYWDEGFHLLPIGLWDNDLSLEIVKSWFGLVDEDGWVGREQILGSEARSRVPADFVVQETRYANPPTLMLAVVAFIERFDQQANIGSEPSFNFQDGNEIGLSGGGIETETLSSAHIDHPTLATKYLNDLYPILRRHYDWFRRTQAGDIKAWDREAFSMKEGYRWRGRTPDHCLTSGLDDYPRARPPHTGELHVDLLSWMGLMTKTLRVVAEKVGEEDDVAELKRDEEAIIRNIDDLHWNEKEQAYCDATIDEYEESLHVCHKGYISLFPLLLGLLSPDSPHLGAVLDLMRDPEELWSPWGLRSLSKKDEYYGQGENYWRGPIWIPIQYLALSSLYKNYINTPGPNQEKAREIYTELRQNVVQNVFKEWKRTGIAWEQYDRETGEGSRAKGFTGWTSMVVMIMAETYK